MTVNRYPLELACRAKGTSARSWSAPALWRFGNSREMNGGLDSLAGLSDFTAKSGRGQPQSKTLKRVTKVQLPWIMPLCRNRSPTRKVVNNRIHLKNIPLEIV